MRYTLSVVFALLAMANLSLAQESRASILGRVSDPTGAAVVGATVRAANTATNTTVNTQTNESGSYDIPYLISGVYNVTVEMAGFKKYVRDRKSVV